MPAGTILLPQEGLTAHKPPNISKKQWKDVSDVFDAVDSLVVEDWTSNSMPSDGRIHVKSAVGSPQLALRRASVSREQPKSIIMMIESMIRSDNCRVRKNNFLPLSFCSVFVALAESESLTSVEVGDTRTDSPQTIHSSKLLKDTVCTGTTDIVDFKLLILVEDFESFDDGVTIGSGAVSQDAVVAADEFEQSSPLGIRYAVVAAVCANSSGISIPNVGDGDVGHVDSSGRQLLRHIATAECRGPLMGLQCC